MKNPRIQLLDTDEIQFFVSMQGSLWHFQVPQTCHWHKADAVLLHGLMGSLRPQAIGKCDSSPTYL